MLVQCRPLFMGETDRLPLDAALDVTQVEFQGLTPFTTPLRVHGEIVCRAGVVTLRGDVSFTFAGRCDRCLTPFSREYVIPMEHILVDSVEDEDSDFVLLENYQLSLDDLVLEDILLELPMKSLCREDCKGLCPICGKNQNDGYCGCKTSSVDPRLDVLRQLLN